MIVVGVALLAAGALSGLALWWFEAHRVRAVVALALALLGLLVTGGWAEATQSLYARASVAVDQWMAADTPAARFEPSGDPTLRALAAEQEPVHPRPHGGDAEALRAWQRTVRAELQALYGVDGAPAEVPPHTVGDPETVDGVERRLVELTSFDGASLPAYLVRPRGVEGRRRAVLLFHGHVGPGQSGIDAYATTDDTYLNSAAVRLARGGFIVLAFELRGFGPLSGEASHRLIAYNALVAGTFYESVAARDAAAALAVLRAQPNVDADRVAVAGASLGGRLALAYAALDESVSPVIVQGYGGRLGPALGVAGGEHVDPPHGCTLVPGANRILRQEDWFALVAPRPLLAVRGREESMQHDALADSVRPVFEAMDAADALGVEVGPRGHEFFVEPALAFLRAHR